MNTTLLRRAGALVLVTLLLACSKGESEAELVASARAYLAQHDAKSAVIQVKNALQENPNSAPARLVLGQALLALGDATGAVVELDRARSLGTDDNEVVPLLARAMLQAGRTQDLLVAYGDTRLSQPRASGELSAALGAAHALQGNTALAAQLADAALKSQPGLPEALVLQAQLKVGERDVDAALALLQQALAQDPSNLQAALLRGNLLEFVKRQPAEAEQTYRLAVKAHPDSAPARSSLIDVLRRQGRRDEAHAETQALVAAAPLQPLAIFQQGAEAFAAKDYRGALDAAERVLKSYPDHAPAQELAGIASYALGSYTQAEAYLTRAVQLDGRRGTARLMLGRTQLRNGGAEQALATLKPLAQSDPPVGEALALMGDAYLGTGDIAAAQAAFARAAQAAPGDSKVMTSVALSQLATGQTAAGSEMLERLAAEDKSPRADLALISARVAQRNFPGALAVADGLRAKLPGSPLPDFWRGRVLRLQKNLPAAAAAFEAALKADPAYFPASAELATMDAQAGRMDRARERLQQVAKANGANFRAPLLLASLESRQGAPVDQLNGLYRDAVRVAPTLPTPRLVWINDMLRRRDVPAALAAAEDAQAALPNSPEITEALGRAQLAAGQNQQAIATLGKLASQPPLNASSQVMLAQAYEAGRNTAKARSAYERALELDPRSADARRGLVVLLLAQDQPAAALASARQLQQIEPDGAAGFLLEGDVLARQGQWPAALTALKTAVARSKSPEAAVALHAALLSSGARAEARALAASWQTDHPRDAVFRYHLGDTALAAGAFAEAEAHYRAVADWQPDNGAALNNIAWLMVRQGKAGALPVAERAWRLVPGSPQVMDTYAAALAADNQLARAVEVQRSAVKSAPEAAGLRLNLARLLLKAGDKPGARAELETLAKLGAAFPGQAEVGALLKTLS